MNYGTDPNNFTPLLNPSSQQPLLFLNNNNNNNPTFTHSFLHLQQQIPNTFFPSNLFSNNNDLLIALLNSAQATSTASTLQQFSLVAPPIDYNQLLFHSAGLLQQQQQQQNLLSLQLGAQTPLLLPSFIPYQSNINQQQQQQECNNAGQFQSSQQSSNSSSNNNSNSSSSSTNWFETACQAGIITQHVISKKDKEGGDYVTATNPPLPALPPPDIAKPAESACRGSAPVHPKLDVSLSNKPLIGFKRVTKKLSEKKEKFLQQTYEQQCVNLKLEEQYQPQPQPQPQELNCQKEAEEAAVSDKQDNSEVKSERRKEELKLPAHLLNFENLKAIKNNIQDLLQIAKHEFAPTGCNNVAPSLSEVMPLVQSYLEGLSFPIDLKDRENYSLFFTRKSAQLSQQSSLSNAALSEEQESTTDDNSDQRTNSDSHEPMLRKQLKLNDQTSSSSTVAMTATNSTGSISIPTTAVSQSAVNVTTAGTSAVSVQGSFVEARRNKKREAKVKSTLKQNEQLSTKFHNLTRLLMYKILRVFNEDDSVLMSRFEISDDFLAHLRQVIRRIKQHSKDTCKNAVKTNFYTHSHYKALFLVLTPDTIATIAKNPKDAQAHRFIFDFDVENVNPVLLAHANLIKHVAFEIVHANMLADTMRESDASIRVKSLLKTSKNADSDSHLSNLRTVYFERAFAGITKMNQGIPVSRF